jgi:hypothetical protein
MQESPAGLVNDLNVHNGRIAIRQHDGGAPPTIENESGFAGGEVDSQVDIRRSAIDEYPKLGSYGHVPRCVLCNHPQSVSSLGDRLGNVPDKGAAELTQGDIRRKAIGN